MLSIFHVYDVSVVKQTPPLTSCEVCIKYAAHNRKYATFMTETLTLATEPLTIFPPDHLQRKEINIDEMYTLVELSGKTK